MKIKISELTTDRKWRSSTGLDKDRFYKLLPLFEITYKDLYGKTVSERSKESKTIDAILENEEEVLFFTLFSLKSGLTYDLLGLVTGMDGSNAKRHQEIGLEVLKKTLSDNGYAPRREFKTVDEFKEYFKNTNTLIFDGTEQRIQRPEEEQKENYSGKKNVIR